MTVTDTTVEAAGSQFPKIVFWDKSAPQISLVNAGDFNRNELIRSLGLYCVNADFSNSFGTRDREEILRRQRTAKYLLGDPVFREFLAGDARVLRDCDHLPSGGQDFLNALWADPGTGHNQFFNHVHRLLAILGRDTLPKELDEFHRFLVETVDNAEAVEKILGKDMGDELEKTTFFEGTIEISFNGRFIGPSKRHPDAWNIEKSEIYGYQKYSYHLSGHCGEVCKPDWMESDLACTLGISKLADHFIRRTEKRREKRRYADLLFTKMPAELQNALVEFAKNSFADGLGPFDPSDSAHFNLYVRYENGKLVVRLIDFYSDNSHKRPSYSRDADCREGNLQSNSPIIGTDYLGYSKSQLERISEQNKQMSVAVARSQRRFEFTVGFHGYIQAKHPCLFKDGEHLEDSGIQRRFGWSTVEGLRNTLKFAERCRNVERYRTLISLKVAELSEISAAVSCLFAKSKEWDLPLSFPEILSGDEHVVSFDRLWPIHLIGRKVGDRNLEPKDLVPICSLLPLNGRMIGLTGQNAGGKTVTEEAVVDAVYLAQSGLPMFGENFALNVKGTLAMVFLERGEGSTLELMLRKTKNVIEAAQKSSGNEIIVFLDEVGTGTQELAGLQWGERVLSALANAGCSVLFSTQITELAKRAQAEMGAVCYKVDLKHRIEPGIGVGGADVLMESLGINRLLDGSNSK